MDLFSDRRILTVSQLTSLVRGVLEENFEHVWVEGDVANLSLPVSGHLYFTLRDTTAQLRCVVFRAAARALRFRLQDGMSLVVRGRLTVYEQRGEYQLVVEYLEPKGVGALQLAFQQLKERLAREGLFDERRKKPLPVLPQRIGIVTSPTGAAIHDILTVLVRRYANLEILIAPVKVQGEGAAAEIAAAINDLNRLGGFDVLIVGRGGGSLEDLWAFNEELVARAIHQSRIPVISAVGHEVDVTIADLVADLRAPTPSAAAELVVQSKEQLGDLVDGLAHRLERSVHQRLRHLWGRLEVQTRSLRDPSIALGHLAQRIDDFLERLQHVVAVRQKSTREHLQHVRNLLRLHNPLLRLERDREALIASHSRLTGGLGRSLERLREQVAVNSAKLDALSPLQVLGRGYSITRKADDGAIIKDGALLQPGDRLDLRFHQGGAQCTVDAASTGSQGRAGALDSP